MLHVRCAAVQGNERLDYFDLSENRFRRLPGFSAPALKDLSVGSGSLEYLPAAMPHWPTLQNLKASSGKLRLLPLWIGRLCQLWALSLSTADLPLTQWTDLFRQIAVSPSEALQ